jgi:TPP-dependent indolepyruvate ferredoxin oxidoreductase alpha subunit
MKPYPLWDRQNEHARDWLCDFCPASQSVNGAIDGSMPNTENYPYKSISEIGCYHESILQPPFF